MLLRDIDGKFIISMVGGKFCGEIKNRIKNIIYL